MRSGDFRMPRVALAVLALAFSLVATAADAQPNLRSRMSGRGPSGGQSFDCSQGVCICTGPSTSDDCTRMGRNCQPGPLTCMDDGHCGCLEVRPGGISTRPPVRAQTGRQAVRVPAPH